MAHQAEIIFGLPDKLLIYATPLVRGIIQVLRLRVLFASRAMQYRPHA